MRLGDLQLEADGPIVYAAFRGEIDLSNAYSIREELTTATPSQADGVVFDLSEVAYLDSAGVRLVHQLTEDLRSRGQKLRLVVPPGSVIHDVLRLAGLDWQGELAQSVDAARAMLEQR